MRSVFIAIVICLLAPVAGAQILFLPVQYQYDLQRPFYYGGSDPAVFAYAEGLRKIAWGRVNGFAFYSGDVRSFREVSSEPLRACSDQLPYENAALYGYNANDARMTAYAAVPRFFCKRDLLAAAVPLPDGSRIVPAAACPLASPAVSSSSTRPSVLIVPGGVLLPQASSPNVHNVISRNK